MSETNCSKSQIKLDSQVRTNFEIKVNTTPKKIKDVCVELVTVNSRP